MPIQQLRMTTGIPPLDLVNKKLDCPKHMRPGACARQYVTECATILAAAMPVDYPSYENRWAAKKAAEASSEAENLQRGEEYFFLEPDAEPEQSPSLHVGPTATTPKKSGVNSSVAAPPSAGCGYRSSNGTCTKPPSGKDGSIRCTKHTCTQLGCSHEKPSKDKLCPQHTAAALASSLPPPPQQPMAVSSLPQPAALVSSMTNPFGAPPPPTASGNSVSVGAGADTATALPPKGAVAAAPADVANRELQFHQRSNGGVHAAVYLNDYITLECAHFNLHNALIGEHTLVPSTTSLALCARVGFTET